MRFDVPTAPNSAAESSSKEDLSITPPQMVDIARLIAQQWAAEPEEEKAVWRSVGELRERDYTPHPNDHRYQLESTEPTGELCIEQYSILSQPWNAPMDLGEGQIIQYTIDRPTEEEVQERRSMRKVMLRRKRDARRLRMSFERKMSEVKKKRMQQKETEQKNSLKKAT